MAFATLAELEQFLQVDFTNDADPAILGYLDQATAAIESHLGRTIEEQSGVIETFDTDGERHIYLSEYPVTAINSVTEDGTALTVNEDFVWYPEGEIARIYGSNRSPWRWPSSLLRGVVVDYDHGYASGSVPEQLQTVCKQIAGRLFIHGAAFANAPKDSAAIVSLQLHGSDSVTYSEAARNGNAATALILESDAAALSPFRRRAFA